MKRLLQVLRSYRSSFLTISLKVLIHIQYVFQERLHSQGLVEDNNSFNIGDEQSMSFVFLSRALCNVYCAVSLKLDGRWVSYNKDELNWEFLQNRGMLSHTI